MKYSGRESDTFAAMVVAFIGSLPSLFFALSCKFTLLVTPTQNLLDCIDTELYRFGYVTYTPYIGNEHTIRYRHGLPRILRWNENKVILNLSHQNVEFFGSIVAVRHIRKCLLKVSE